MPGMSLYYASSSSCNNYMIFLHGFIVCDFYVGRSGDSIVPHGTSIIPV